MGAPPSAGNTLPSSFYSGLHQAWLTPVHLLRVHMCVWLALTPLLRVAHLCSGLPWGLCWPFLSIVSQVFWLLILFSNTFMSPWRGQVMSFCEEPGPGLVIMNVCWMNVQTQSDWCRMFESVTLSLFSLERLKWWCSVWYWCWGTPSVHCVVRWGMVYLYLCVHSLERGHSHVALNPCLVCWCFL